MVVVAAGNNGRDNDVVATYSSKGPTTIDDLVTPDLLAPGNRVISYEAPGATLTTAYASNRIAINGYSVGGASTASPYFFTLSGTSMATPVVCGAALALLDKTPTLTPDQVKAKLMKTAWRGFPATMYSTDPTTGVTYTANHDAFTIGAGQVDLWAAFNNTDSPTGSAASPMVTFSSGQVQWQLNSTSASSVIWGTGTPFATSVIWVTNLCGNSVFWGTSSPWALSTPGAEAVSVAIQGEP